MPTFRSTLPLTLAFALAASIAAAGEAKTPMGKWMKPNMGAPLAGEDYATLQKSFDVVASKVPSADYANWASISKSGAAAAAKQDLAGVKAACKQCHDQYRKKYVAEFPTRPFP